MKAFNNVTKDCITLLVRDKIPKFSFRDNECYSSQKPFDLFNILGIRFNTFFVPIVSMAITMLTVPMPTIVIATIAKTALDNGKNFHNCNSCNSNWLHDNACHWAQLSISTVVMKTQTNFHGNHCHGNQWFDNCCQWTLLHWRCHLTPWHMFLWTTVAIETVAMSMDAVQLVSTVTGTMTTVVMVIGAILIVVMEESCMANVTMERDLRATFSLNSYSW